MSKKKVRKSNVITSDAIEREHPDGGTFGIIAMSPTDAEGYAKVVTQEELWRDNGHVLFSPGKRRQPVTRLKLTIADLVGFAATRLEYVRDFLIEGLYVDLENTENGWAFFDRARLVEVNGESEWQFVEDRTAKPSFEPRSFGPLRFTPMQMLEHILRMPAESDIPFFVWYDSEGRIVQDDDPEFDRKATRKERLTRRDLEGYHSWVVRESAQLSEELMGIVRGNSSTAPSKSSDSSSAAMATPATTT